MSPEQLLVQLEKLGNIDAKVLRKIRQQIGEHDQDPHKKPVTSKTILKYLVQKGFVSESIAASISESVEEQPKARTYDTTDLIGAAESDLISSLASPAASPVSPSKDDRKRAGLPGKDAAKVETPAPPVEKSGREKKKRALAAAETILDTEMLEAWNQPAQKAGFDDPFGSESGMAGQEDGGSKLGFKGKLDKRDQWATKWLYIAFTVIGLLFVAGVILTLFTFGVSAEDKFQFANESYNKLNYLDAAKKFSEFLEAHPTHKHSPEARARLAHSYIAASVQSGQYEDAIRKAETLLPPIIDDKDGKIDLLREDLAVLLPRSLLAITDKAKLARTTEELKAESQRCKKLKTVIDNNAFIPTSQRKKPKTADDLTKIDNNIRIIDGQIKKESDYSQAILEINRLGDEGKTNDAFSTYRKLTREYGDLAGREELKKSIQAISLKEQNLVTSIVPSANTSNTERISPITRSYLLTRQNGKKVGNLNDEIFVFLAEGSVYALRGSDGEILWRHFVGFQTDIQPQLIGDRVLIGNQQDFDLLMLNRESGQVVWRTEIGEPFFAPAVNSEMIVLTTKSGKLWSLVTDSGKIEKGIQLPQSVESAAMIADKEPYIYQVGSYSNLYVLSKEDLTCKEVFYLGHEPGSISVPPIYWSGHIVVAANRGNAADLWVFKPDETGLELRLLDVMAEVVQGAIRTPMQRFSRWMLVASDLGNVRIMELTNEETTPVVQFARYDFANSGSRTHLLTEGSNVWISGKEISRVKFQRSQGSFQTDTIANAGDNFLAPSTKIDDFVFHVRRRKNSEMLSASLVEAMSLKEIWRTDFGGPVPGAPVVDGQRLNLISSQGDLYQIDPAGRKSLTPVSTGSEIMESLKFRNVSVLSDSSLAAMGSSGQSEMFFVKAGQGSLVRLAQQADQPACEPLVLENHLIVPSLDGPILRVNPANGQLVGTPFLPPVTAGRKTKWFEPTLIDKSRFAIASGKSEGTESVVYILSAEDEKSIREVAVVKTDSPFKSRLINDGRMIFGVSEGPVVDQLVSIGTESNKVEKTVEMDSGPEGKGARVVAGPWLIGDKILVRTNGDQLVMYDQSLTKIWHLDVANDQIAGKPEMLGNQMLVGFQNGKLIAVDVASGAISRTFQLGQPINSSPTRLGKGFYVSGLDGTVHEIDFSREGK